MLNLSTSKKIFLATILSKLLILLFQKKKFIVSRNGIKYKIYLDEGVDLGIFLGVGLVHWGTGLVYRVLGLCVGY